MKTRNLVIVIMTVAALGTALVLKTVLAQTGDSNRATVDDLVAANRVLAIFAPFGCVITEETLRDLLHCALMQRTTAKTAL